MCSRDIIICFKFSRTKYYMFQKLKYIIQPGKTKILSDIAISGALFTYVLPL